MSQLRSFSALIAILVFVFAIASCKAPDGADRRVGTSTSGTGGSSTARAGATPHPTSTPNDGVRRVTPEDAVVAVQKGQAVIIDVRAAAEYNRSHIKGSKSIPRNEIEKHLSELPKDKLIIFYCA